MWIRKAILFCISFSDRFCIDLGTIFNGLLTSKPWKIHVRIDASFIPKFWKTWSKKKVPRCYMWHVQSFISIRFLQCFWTIRSLRTCVNFSIRALVHYLNLQLKHLSKNVPKSMSETITIFIPISIDLFIDFGSQNPSKTNPKSTTNQRKILSRNMFEKYSIWDRFWTPKSIPSQRNYCGRKAETLH